LLLRPIAHRIDRQPIGVKSEVKTLYRFEATCRANEEAHIRALVTQAASASKFRLCAVRSEDVGHDLVRVTAILEGTGRDDVALEDAVSRLSLEPSVSAVNWSIDLPDQQEDL
jgi:putative Mg2+ transporter-C (MgtC) family protein